MSWMSAWGRGVAIFAYFALTTVWLPDFVLAMGALADASQLIRDLTVLAIWGGAMVVGIVGLRVAQRRGLV